MPQREAKFDLLLTAVRSGRAALRDHPTDLPSVVPNQLAAHGLTWPEIASMVSETSGRPLLRLEQSFDVQIGPVAIQRGTRATACAVRFDMVVAGTEEGRLRFWASAVADGERQAASNEAHNGPVSVLSFVGSDELLLSGGVDGVVRLWPPTPDGRPVGTFTGHNTAITHVALVGHNRVIAAAVDGSIRVWDRDSGVELCALIGHSGPITTLEGSLDHSVLVSGSTDGTLRVWDLTAGRVRAVLRGHRGEITACAIVNRPEFVVNSMRVLSASTDGVLKVWSPDGDQSMTLGGHTGAVRDLRLIRDRGESSPLAITGGDDGTVRVWDLEQGQGILIMRGHRGPVTRVLAIGDSVSSRLRDGEAPRRALSASPDGFCRLWDLDSGRSLHEYRLGRSHIAHLSAAVTGEIAACVTDEGALVSIDLSAESSEQEDTASTPVALSRTGDQVMVGSGKHVRWINLAKAGGTSSREAGSGPTLAVAMNWTADYYVSLHPGEVRYWSLGGVQTQVYTVPADITAIGLSPSGSLLLTGSADGTLRVWRQGPSGLQVLSQFPTRAAIHACACDMSEVSVVSAAQDGSLDIRDLKTGAALRTIFAHQQAALACDIAHNGVFALSASADGTLKVWDCDSGLSRRTLEGHAGPVIACRIAQGTDRAVSCSRDGSVKLWNLTNGRCLETFYGDAPFMSLSLSPRAPLVAVADEAGRVLILRNTEARTESEDAAQQNSATPIP